MFSRSRWVSYLSAAALALTVFSSAGEVRADAAANAVPITQLYVAKDSVSGFTLLWIGVASPLQTYSCGSTNNKWIVVDANSVLGKTALSLATAAYLSKRPINMMGYGPGYCVNTSSGSVEVLKYLWLI